MICKNCKSRNISMRDFCHNCGEPLREPKVYFDIKATEKQIKHVYFAVSDVLSENNIDYKNRKILNRTKKELKKYLILNENN